MLANRPPARNGLPRLCAGVTLLLLALTAGACGSKVKAPAGLVTYGPGVSETKPPWKPEYAHLAERTRRLGLPKVGDEKFHIHAMLHIYVDGLLSPIPADIGIDTAKKLETSMHTHDSTGIIHMEAEHRFNFTLGDFFTVWGVKLGPAQLGNLTGLGGDKLHFYINGRPLHDPAARVLHNGDSVVIGYGPVGSFPHKPSIFLLEEVEQGKGGLGCSPIRKGKRATSCLAAKPQAAKPAPSTPTAQTS